MSGGIIYGENSAQLGQVLSARWPSGVWLSHSRLERLVGPDDPRFRAADVIELDCNDPQFAQHLRAPKHIWFPLLGSALDFAVALSLPDGTSCLKAARNLASDFPRRLFLTDPFVQGPRRAWQGHTRLAELPNIFITTLGLQNTELWPNEELQAALHFVSGEVGASKLLFASGCDLSRTDKPGPQAWLNSITTLDDAQRELILRTNARELFGPNR